MTSKALATTRGKRALWKGERLGIREFEEVISPKGGVEQKGENLGSKKKLWKVGKVEIGKINVGNIKGNSNSSKEEYKIGYKLLQS